MSGAIALVTGGATGIGAAVGARLAGQGMRVVVCDINAAQGEAQAKRLDGKFVHCDVGSLGSVEAAVAECVEAWGVPQYVHLNAGIMTVPTGEPFVAIEDVSEAQYRRILGVNLDGVFHGVKTLLPLMRAHGGAITLTASTAGLTVVPVDALYTASKYAVIGFGRAVAAANAGTNVRINVICPGVTDTAIVPDAYRGPEFGIMPAEVIAAEVVDLLLQGENGEVRVKTSDARPAFAAEVPDLT